MLWTFLIFLVTTLRSIESQPQRVPPPHYIDEYTLHGEVPLEYFFVDDTLGGQPTHFVFSKLDMQRSQTAMRKVLMTFEQSLIRCCAFSSSQTEELFMQAPNEVRLVPTQNKREIVFNFTTATQFIHMFPKTQWIAYSLFLLQNELVRDRSVLVYGSSDPWLENLMLLFGAKQVTTVEYNRLTYEDPRVTTISAEDFDEFYSPESVFRESFDLAISPSAFDHDGLGRYGDPINPHADLIAMQRVKGMLKPQTGKLVLTVPIGPDVVVFNLHRRYGSKRLPLLLQGWQIEQQLGWQEHRLSEQADWRQTYEPILILSPRVSETTVFTSTNNEL